MVFQNYALYPHMTVARQHGLLAEAEERAEGRDRGARRSAPPRSSGWRRCSTRYPRQLSGGQRQRVAMGRAIVRDPQVFLFDEPLSNLDAKLRVAMRAEIKELHQRLKTTTVYVTHDQIEAMTMADKIVVMHDGIVEQIGAPLELYDRPDNLFVAGFIGSPAMNFLRWRRSAAMARHAFEGAGGIPPAAGRRGRRCQGHAGGLGIRPEHLSSSDGGIPARSSSSSRPARNSRSSAARRRRGDRRDVPRAPFIRAGRDDRAQPPSPALSISSTAKPDSGSTR